jgi:hypothetical protein
MPLVTRTIQYQRSYSTLDYQVTELLTSLPRLSTLWSVEIVLQFHQKQVHVTAKPDIIKP